MIRTTNNKALIGITLIVLFMASTSHQSFALTEKFCVSKSFVEIDIDSFCMPLGDVNLMSVAKYHNHYIVLFRERFYDHSTISEFSHIIAISENNHHIQIVKSNIGRFDISDHAKMFVRNDSLLIKGYYKNDKNFCIEEADGKWMMNEVQAVGNQIYEDSIYRVDFSDFGEFGSYLSFIEKESQIEHAYSCIGTRIFRLSDGYYLCGNYGIGYIADPNKGKTVKVRECNMYTVSVPEVLYDIQKGRSLWFNPIDTIYHAAFMHNNKIHLLASDRKTTYIEVFDGNRTQKVWSLGTKLATSITSCVFGKNNQREGALCWFNGINDREGFVDIHGDSISIFELRLKHRPIIHTNKDAVQQTLKHFLPVLKTSTLSDADAFEKQIGGITNGHIRSCHVADVDKPNLVEKSYYHLISPKLTQKTTYGFDKDTNMLDYIIIEWVNTQTILTGSYHSIKNSLIANKMISIVNKATGCRPTSTTKERIWQKNNLRLSLWKSEPLFIIN